MDIEITKNKERGVAVLKFYGPNSKTGESTLMINKSKRYDVKFVKILAIDVIKKMIDTFISGEGWNFISKKTTQTKKKQFNCPTCKKIFKSEKNLNIHKEKYHIQNRYSCDNCGYEATDCTTLNVHMQDHTVREKQARKNNCKEKELPDFCCNVCEFTTTDKNSLEIHQRSHTKKEYVCGNCEFTTELRYKIKEHIKDTHGEKDEQKLPSEEPEEMEIDEDNEKTEIGKEKKEDIGEEEEKKLRSKLLDKKIIENQRKRDQEEHRLKLEEEETER